jgi:cytochrome c oxidase assembly protein subunit 15
MLLVLGLQIGLGLANVIFNFPVAVAVAHNLVGALLVLTLITLNYKVFTSTAGNRNSI